MKTIFYTVGLVFWASLVFGQKYVDTISYHGKNQSISFSSSELGNATHGKTVVNIKRGKTLEISRSDMKYIHRHFREDTHVKPDVKIPLRSESYGGFDYELLDNFQNGVDSVFKQYVDEDGEPFIYRVIKLFDTLGTAQFTQYYENGNIQVRLNYTADTTDIDIYVTGFIKGGEEIVVHGNYLVEDFLEDYKNNKDIIPIFDTVYMSVGMLHGEELHYYENGNISYHGNIDYKYKDGVLTTYHKNGQKAGEQVFDKGKRIGTWTAWFEDGKVEEYNYFEKDLPIGIWKKWHRNGQLIQEKTMVEAKDKSGRFRHIKVKIDNKEWYSDGQLKKSERILEGFSIRKLGDYIEYYPNGELKENGKFSKPVSSFLYALFTFNSASFREMTDPIFGNNDGLKNGKWKYYNQKGELLTTQKYRFGLLKKEKRIADELIIFDYFNPPIKEHCRSQINLHIQLDDDSKSEDKTYCVNRREIVWTDTFYNHVVNDYGDSIRYVFEIVDFFDKQGHIHYKRFYPNGQIMANYTYGGGDYEAFDEPLKDNWNRSGNTGLNGTATFWYSNGQIKWIEENEEIMKNFTIANKRVEYYENGQMKSISHPHSYEKCIWKTWYENGQLMEEMHYKDNTKEGVQLKWNKNGTLIEKLNYKNYKLHGKQFYYDNKGKLIKEEVYENGKLQE